MWSWVADTALCCASVIPVWKRLRYEDLSLSWPTQWNRKTNKAPPKKTLYYWYFIFRWDLQKLFHPKWLTCRYVNWVLRVLPKRVSQEGKAREEFCFPGSYQLSGLYAQRGCFPDKQTVYLQCEDTRRWGCWEVIRSSPHERDLCPFKRQSRPRVSLAPLTTLDCSENWLSAAARTSLDTNPAGIRWGIAKLPEGQE